AQNCSQPNQNTVLCDAVPLGAVDDCGSANNANDCASSEVADIANFPDGTQAACSGTTAQKQTKCITITSCTSNNDQPPFKCVAGTTHNPKNGAETIVGKGQCTDTTSKPCAPPGG